MRTLVVTADDLGLDEGVNAAVAELARTGRITAASLMTRRPLAGAALALDLPVAVGLHVELDRRELVERRRDVRRRIEDQHAWMTGHGAHPTHIDLHTAALYGLGADAPGPATGVVPEALEVAGRHAVPLRLPRHLPPMPVSDEYRELHAVAVDRADALGVRIPEVILTDPRPAATITGYDDLREMYTGLLLAVADGVSEVFLHPALPGTGHEPGRVKREWEYRLLRSGDLHAAIEAEGITLTHW